MRALLVALFVVALAGCGGEARVSKAEYEEHLDVGRETISESFTAVFARAAKVSQVDPPRSKWRPHRIEEWRLDLGKRLAKLRLRPSRPKRGWTS
jgi:hypothetical protein